MMRVKKTGLETLARKENPNLLDLSGDTVHMVSNTAKTLMRPIGSDMEYFCSTYDIEKSYKQKNEFIFSPCSCPSVNG